MIDGKGLEKTERSGEINFPMLYEEQVTPLFCL